MDDRKQRLNGEKLTADYFHLSLPVVLGSIVTIVYSLADTYFIAQTENSLLIAGVSVCSPIFMILMAFGNIFGQGGSSLISRLLGKNSTEDAGRVSAFCFWIALAVGVVIGALMLLCSEWFLLLLGSSPDTLPYAREYGTVLMIGAPFIVVNFIHMNLLRCEGMSGLSMLGTVIGAAVNIILDPLLIPHMGAQGAAIATVIGYLLSDLFLLSVALMRSKVLSVQPVFMVEKAYFKDILFIGVTAAITNIATSLCTILVNQNLSSYGDDKIAAMGIVLKVTMIVQMILVGFSFGGIPLFGFLSGAGEQQKIRKLFRFCLLFLCLLALAMTLIVYFAAGSLIGVITPDAALTALAVPMLRWHVAGSVFAGIVMLSTCLCQASGKALPALVLSLSRQGVVFVVVLLAAARIAGYQGILASQCVADILSVLIAVPIVLKTVFFPKKAG